MELFKLVGSIFVKNDEANRQLDETARKAEKLASTVGNACVNAGNKITNVGKSLVPMSTAVTTVLGASVKSASDFTDGMAKMSTLFDTNKTSVNNLSKEFIALSNKTGIASTELAEAGYEALSAGVDVKNAVGFVETAGNLAKVGFTSTSTAVDVLTTTMNAYGKEAGTAEEISNKLVRTQNLGKTTVDELAHSMGQIIPTASSMGVNIDNLTSGYVSLTSQGIATAEATTYMNSMFNELGDSGTQLGGIIKEKTGMSFQDCMKSGMSLADVLQVTKQYADENGIAYNELWSSAEAGKAGLAILNGGVDEFNSTVSTMADKTNDVGLALDKLNTPSVQAQTALNQIKNSGIELGVTLLSSLQPTIELVANAISTATSNFQNLDDRTKTILVTFLTFVAGLAPVLLVLGQLTTAFGTLTTGIGSVASKVLTLIGHFPSLTTAFTMLTSPIGLVVTAITGLIAVFVTLYNTNDNFRNLVNTAWETIKNKISSVLEAVKNSINVFVTAVQTVWNKWGDSLKSITSSVFDAISTVINTVLDAIKNVIKIFTSVITGDWKTALEGIKGLTSTIFNAIKNVISSVLNAIQTVVSNVLDVVKSLFSSVFESIKSVVSNALNGIQSVVSNGLDGIRNNVSNALDNVHNAFSNIWENVKDVVYNAIEYVKGLTNFSWSLPDIALPHFSIEGSFSLDPPSIPYIGVDWYAKAMDEPYLFTKPTLFNVNPLGGVKGAGEAGDEMIYGRNNLMNDISESVANQNSGIVQAIYDSFDKLFDILESYLPNFTREMVLDTGLLVASIAEDMDGELGIIQQRRGR